MTARTDRIDELLRQEIGAILSRDVQDPRIGFVTVTDVETAPDLSTARVWVSVIGQPAERTETMRALERAMPFVRHELGSRIRLRRIPELHVRADDTAERGTRVLRLLAELESGASPDEVAPAGESLPTPAGRGTAEEGSADSRARGRRGKRERPERGLEAAPPTMSVDLTPWLDAVPEATAGALTAARNALVVCHENPDADTLGAAIAVGVIVEAHGGRATLISTDPVPPLYSFLDGMDRFLADPEADPDRRLRPARRLRLRHPRPGRRGPRSASRAVRSVAARDHRPPCLDDEHRRERLGRPGRGRHL